jgi:hypothetical protein
VKRLTSTRCLLALPVLLLSGLASAECTLKSAPFVFEPAGGARPQKFTTGFTNDLDLYKMPSGERRLLVMENYGYATFSLGNPAAPAILGYQDMSSTVPQQGDGQSIIISLAATADGSRALVNWKQSPFGTFLMRPSLQTFDFAGNYAGFRATGGVVVDPFPVRSIAYALTYGGLYVADVSNFVTGVNSIQASTIPSQLVSAPSVTLPNHLTRAGHFIVYSTGSQVVVIDGSSPGWSGAISTGFPVYTLAPTAFGLGASDRILNVAAALHPVTGRLFVMAEGSSSYVSTGIGFVSTATDAISFQRTAAPFAVPSPYGGSSGLVTTACTLVATSTDLLALVWEHAPNGNFKLFTLSVAGWGTDRSPSIVTDASALPSFAVAQAMRGFSSGSDVYTYVAAQQGGVGFPLTCTPVYAIGDANGDGALDVADVFALINYLFAGGAAPVGDCDVNADKSVDVADVFALINYLFAGGPPPG